MADITLSFCGPGLDGLRRELARVPNLTEADAREAARCLRRMVNRAGKTEATCNYLEAVLGLGVMPCGVVVEAAIGVKE